MSDPVPPTRSNHPLLPPSALAPAPAVPAGAGAGPAWPSFTGTADLVGTSTRGVSVYVDPATGAQGRQNAQDLLAAADGVMERNDAIFAIRGGPVDAIVFALNGQTDGTGGADHGGCTFSTGDAIEVDAAFGSPERVIALFEAELSECAMNGSLCGYSNGEALSRWCAAVIGANALADFATAPQWAQDGMPNWVDRTEPTDTDPDSVGCAMAFISWLIGAGHTLPQIAQAMVALGDAGTLATLYARLSGGAASGAWSAFRAALDALAGGVTNDDPFGALAQAM